MAYLVALALLLVNDHVLKYVWPGFVTGKLSDFAGLFTFAAFFASVAPRRAAAICAGSGVLFVWWKSPLSQTVVDTLGLARVVDWTDLAALAVLPFACRLAQRNPIRWRPAIACVSLVAFAMSSVPRWRIDIPDGDPLERVETHRPIEKALGRLVECGIHSSLTPALLQMSYNTRVLEPRNDISVSATYWTEADGIVLRVNTITVWRGNPTMDERAVRAELQRRLDGCFRL